eukprot:9487973-Pyramimonas_sp.AAC.1
MVSDCSERPPKYLEASHRRSERAAHQFWESKWASKFVTRHPCLPRDSRRRMVPIGFRGDCGGFNGHDSRCTSKWNSLLAAGRT